MPDPGWGPVSRSGLAATIQKAAVSKVFARVQFGDVFQSAAFGVAQTSSISATTQTGVNAPRRFKPHSEPEKHFRFQSPPIEVVDRVPFVRELRRLRAAIVASGARLLTWDEVDEELERRRGDT